MDSHTAATPWLSETKGMLDPNNHQWDLSSLDHIIWDDLHQSLSSESYYFDLPTASITSNAHSCGSSIDSSYAEGTATPVERPKKIAKTSSMSILSFSNPADERSDLCLAQLLSPEKALKRSHEAAPSAAGQVAKKAGSTHSAAASAESSGKQVACIMKGIGKPRRGKRRRPSRRKKDAPKEEMEKDRSFSSPLSNPKRRKSLLEKLRHRLSGGHFRMLNEKLYTCSGNEAFHFFMKEPELFDVYHAGYQEQMTKWPEQPVNIIVKWLKCRDSSLVVADFGCGNASLAKNIENKVFSIDLVSAIPSVIACDMSDTPLESKSIDVAVFCLSLMGINYSSYLKEANRVIKPGGWLLVAEVRSRLDPNNGGADPDKFSAAVKQLGFKLNSKDFSNKMFVLFYFKKMENSSTGKAIDWPELKPCLYKRR